MLLSSLIHGGGAALPDIGDCAFFAQYVDGGGAVTSTSYVLTADLLFLPLAMNEAVNLADTGLKKLKLPYTSITNMALSSMLSLTDLVFATAAVAVQGAGFVCLGADTLTSFTMENLQLGSVFEIVGATLSSVAITTVVLADGAKLILGSGVAAAMSITSLQVPDLAAHVEMTLVNALTVGSVNTLLGQIADLGGGYTGRPFADFGNAVGDSSSNTHRAACVAHGWSLGLGGTWLYSFLPDDPAVASLTALGETTAELTLADPVFGQATFGYQLLYDDGTSDVASSGVSSFPHQNFSGLLTNYPYNFVLLASNNQGNSNPVSTAFTTTGTPGQLRSVSNLTKIGNNPGYVQAGWVGVPYADGYAVAVFPDVDGSAAIYANLVGGLNANLGAGSTSDLVPGTPYRFTVTANDSGTGRNSAPVTITLLAPLGHAEPLLSAVGEGPVRLTVTSSTDAPGYSANSYHFDLYADLNTVGVPDYLLGSYDWNSNFVGNPSGLDIIAAIGGGLAVQTGLTYEVMVTTKGNGTTLLDSLPVASNILAIPLSPSTVSFTDNGGDGRIAVTISVADPNNQGFTFKLTSDAGGNTGDFDPGITAGATSWTGTLGPYYAALFGAVSGPDTVSVTLTVTARGRSTVTDRVDTYTAAVVSPL